MGVSKAETWDLEVFFPGGFEGERWRTELASAEADVEALIPRADALGDPAEDAAWDAVLAELDDVAERLGELFAYAHCVVSDDTEHREGNKAVARLSGLFSRWTRAWIHPEQVVGRADDATWSALIGRPGLAAQRPRFDDLRVRSHLLLPAGEQTLLTELSEPAMGSWSRLYDRISGRLRAQVGDESLSVGQAFNRLDHADAAMRESAFHGIEGAWSEALDDCAEILGNITRTRQAVADRLGVAPIELPLADHRLSRGTLDAMVGFCENDCRPLMHRYFAAKTKALGTDKLDFWDLRAPIGHGGDTWTWGRAQDFIVEQFGTFSGDMADFATRSFVERQVEVEDRPGKRQGAFCIPFRCAKQSRVFMTWSGTTTNLVTLAHELGHAWHNEVMWDLPTARNRVPSTLAESASTFAEAVVRGAALAQAPDDAAELALLEQEMQAASVMLVNIPTRMGLELALFDERAKGPLDAARLSEIMESLQRRWYGPSLGAADPTFWANKLHFYLTRSFYNYPYTFGYLFSGLIHARAVAEGPAWAPSYTALLRDTGAGPCEDVAAKHLGIDLRDAAAWTPILGDLEAKVARYEALVG
jgi:oligoendopeptidase F